jgi:enoyl-CoA hydratase/carnithine racemase
MVTDIVQPDDLLARAQQKAEEMAAVPLRTLQATKALVADREYTERRPIIARRRLGTRARRLKFMVTPSSLAGPVDSACRCE